MAGTDDAVLLEPIGVSPTTAICENCAFAGEVTVTDMVWPGFIIVSGAGEVIWRTG